jgi:hypothetical protein
MVRRESLSDDRDIWVISTTLTCVERQVYSQC